MLLARRLAGALRVPLQMVLGWASADGRGRAWRRANAWRGRAPKGHRSAMRSWVRRAVHDAGGDVEQQITQLLRFGHGVFAVQEQGAGPGEQVDPEALLRCRSDDQGRLEL
jgi:hypothetical protein